MQLDRIETTIVGNLTGDPRITFTPKGVAVCNMSVAMNERVLNKETQKWEEKEPTFIRLVLWRDAAENAAESYTQGSRVIAHGVVTLKSYIGKDAEGYEEVKPYLEMNPVVEMGPSTRFATVKINKVDRKSQQSNGDDDSSNGDERQTQKRPPRRPRPRDAE